MRKRARAAYERGRRRAAIATGLFITAPALLALQTWGSRPLTLLLSVLLFAALVGARWRGGPAFAGAFLGLLVGSLPLMTLSVLRSAGGHLCFAGLCMQACVPVCFGSGLIAGILLASRARRGAASLSYWSGAGTVGGLSAALGCVPLGMGAGLGMLAGLALTALPIMAWRGARAR